MLNVKDPNIRLFMCEQCPKLKPKWKTCEICGCFMKLKVRLKKASCPLGKW